MGQNCGGFLTWGVGVEQYANFSLLSFYCPQQEALTLFLPQMKTSVDYKLRNQDSSVSSSPDSPSSLVPHIEERYITIFRMQNNSQIIICEHISRR